MTLIEALKSEKNYKRVGSPYWYDASRRERNGQYSIREILAEDWEVEEKFEITGTQLKSIMEETAKRLITIDELHVIILHRLGVYK